jgi:rod shape-determining protein MreC
MDLILNRYRNLTVLLVALLAQLILLAYQVKSNQEVRLIRVWAVTAVTPLARVLESGRSSTVTFFRDYFVLLDVREENKRLKTDLSRFQMENQHLRAELSTADRASALAIFQAQTPMKTVAAHIIGSTTDSSAKAVLIDRGSLAGIQKGMAVITPDGIVGKVTSVYPTASYVLLVSDPTFAAGVISQKNHVHGTLKGQGSNTVFVDNVQNEENVEAGDLFFTSGDDGIFPKGLPAGAVVAARPGRGHKDIFLAASGFQNGLEEVLIIVEGVHLPIPEMPTVNQPVFIQPPPPAEGDTTGVKAPSPTGAAATDMDRLHQQYKNIADQQKHEMGERGRGAPDFNILENGGAPKANSKGPAPAPRP